MSDPELREKLYVFLRILLLVGVVFLGVFFFVAWMGNS